MTRIITSEDCGNSPKNTFVANLSIALALGDSAFVLDSVSGDIRWHRIGTQPHQGKDALALALAQVASEPPEELTILHAVTHGRAGAVNGTFILRNGDKRAFCHIFELNGAKGTSVKEITSYLVDTA